MSKIKTRKIYTESALNDKFIKFFKSFKKEKNYQYIEKIDSAIYPPHHIKIDFEDLTDELKQIVINESEVRVHFALYRSIGEIFQAKYGTAETQRFQNENYFKFEILNHEKYNSKIFENPKLIYWETADEGRFTGEQKIGNAATQIKMDHKFCTLRANEEILMYNGKIYDDVAAKTIIKEEVEKIIPDCTVHHRREVIEKIKAQTYTDHEDFDTDHALITINNGILNISKVEINEHTPKHLSRILIPRSFKTPKHKINDETIFTDIEKNLADTEFYQFLKRSFTINGKVQQSSLETVLEILASPLIKRQIDDKAFMNLGAGNNGKTIFLGYIAEMYGEANGSNISLHELADDKFYRANLDGKSYNVFPDLEENSLKHTGIIKALISGERIESQKKNQQGYSMKAFAKLIFSCNRFPKVYDNSPAFFRRWIIVKWDRDFEGDPERDVTLKIRLYENKTEIDKVFSCIVYLANKLNKTNKFTHNKNAKEIQEEWNRNADPVAAYNSKYIEDSEGYKTKTEVYKHYKQSMDLLGERPLNMNQFSNAFSQCHEQERLQVNNIRQRVWMNMGFKKNTETAPAKRNYFCSGCNTIWKFSSLSAESIKKGHTGCIGTITEQSNK